MQAAKSERKAGGANDELSPILGLRIFRPRVMEDHRGTFVETWNDGQFESRVGDVRFVRDAISTSCRHTLRGLHHDDCTWKLIQCLQGRIYFVVADMREESPTYRQWEAFTLTEHNRMQVLVPPRFANGHLVMSETCTFHYKMSAYYDGGRERVLLWNDPEVGIYWPVANPILSEKDAIGYWPDRGRKAA